MYLRITLLVFVASCTSWSAAQTENTPQSGLVVTFPKTLLFNTTEKICFTAAGLDGELLADLMLHDFSHTCSMSRVQWRGMEKDHCLDLPGVVCHGSDFHGSARGNLHLRVFGQSQGSNVSRVHEQEKSVSLVSEKVETFIQSDKPMYQPGQKVMFRVLTVTYPRMIPQVGNMYTVWITSPSGTRMQQWRDQTSPDGLLDLDFSLSSEPELGKWRIHVSLDGIREEASQQFTVEEYVLPKFEVTITTPQSLFMGFRGDVPIKVCAMYTYGQPVHGTVHANITAQNINPHPLHWWDRRKPARPVVPMMKDADETGCANFDFPLALLHMTSRNYLYSDQNLIVTANFTERGTDVTMSATSSSTTFSMDAIKLSIEGPNVFKPGLPYKGQVKVTFPSGMPAPPHNVSLRDVVQNTGQIIETGMDGIGHFELQTPTHAETTGLNLRADFHGQSRELYNQRPSYSSRELYFNPPTARKTLTAWFSPSGSFLDIAPIAGRMTSGQSVPIQLSFTLPESETVSEIEFSYRVISRGRIVLGGSHTWTDTVIGVVPVEVRTQPGNVRQRHPFYRMSASARSQRSRSRRRRSSPPIFPGLEETTPPQLDPYQPTRRRQTQFSFEAAAAMSPMSRVLVYYVRSDREVVSASTEFKMAQTFENQVSLEFLEGEQVRPGYPASLAVSAQPGSLCAVGTVDKSVHIMGGDNKLTKAKMFSPVASFNEIGGSMSTQCPTQSSSGNTRTSSRHVDSIESFRTAGVDVLTGFQLETRPCWITTSTPCRYWHCRVMYSRPMFHLGEPGVPEPRGPQGPVLFDVAVSRVQDNPVAVVIDAVDQEVQELPVPEPLVELRSYFPETWLWKLSRLGPDGRYVSQQDIPHTITEWVADAFCLSPEHGVGVADTASIRAFQPFFLSYTIPYSVIRGEKVPIKVTVFNYLTSCLNIQLSMTETTNFSIEARPAYETVEVCGNSAETLEYEILPISLGDIPIRVSAMAEPSAERGDVPIDGVTFPVTDAIEDTILVEPEGAEREETFSELICPSDSQDGIYENTVPLRLPTWFVEGSARGRIQVIGDIMGPVMSNLDNLLRMPYGCGEQNMIFMAPNIYVMQYLTQTGQVTSDIEEKALKFMQSGYQREQTYQLTDASYSAFGQSDGEGSTWLTAFVLKCFSQAQDLMEIDGAKLDRTRDWLANNGRDENGCIIKRGRVIHKEMQGSVSSPVTMTAFVTISMIEAGASPQESSVIQGLECIKNGLLTEDRTLRDESIDTYTLAISSYALGLGEYYPSQSDLLFYLEERAQGTEHLWYWSGSDRDDVETEESMCVNHCHHDSSAVEITSYVLLAYLHQGADFSEVLPTTMPIIKWLNTQRNALGGFSSTQDTVLGLQALSHFAREVYNPDSPLSLNIDVIATRDSPNDHSEYSFEVHNNNRLVLQREELVEVPTELNVTGAGTGCALFQAELRYNVPVVAPNRLLFDIRAEVTEWEGNAVTDPSVCGDKTLTVCVQYTGNGDETGMAVVEVKMVSGYVPHEASLNEFQSTEEANRIRLKRFDKYKPGEPLSLYFDQFDRDVRCIPVNMKQEFIVKDTKDAVIKVYDYYKPGVVGYKRYNTFEDLEL